VARARGWGIGVPGDPSQVVYVWFDALTNYISALRYGEPGSADLRTWWTSADHRVHVVGKGILRFHAVYWPAFLASAGQPPPTRIQVHPYLTVGGAKLAKSSGTVVAPTDVVDAYGSDALRWWFAREVGAAADTDFTTERLVTRANDDLANTLGNVTNRIATLVHRHRGGVVPALGEQDGEAPGPPAVDLADVEAGVAEAIAELDLRGAARLVVGAAAALNRHLETTAPWALARDAGRAGELDRLLAGQVAAARTIARAAAPIVPRLAARLLDQLGGAGRLPEPAPAFARLPAP
jgi:methionyl-tRNA synthetase